MKKIKLPTISIEGVQYELEIDTTTNTQSVCFECELGVKRCMSLYHDYEECPCNTLCPDGYHARCLLRAKKAGQ